MQDVELTPTSYIVLSLIDASGRATPYALKRAAAARIGDFWSLAHSHLYAETGRLAAGGYLLQEQEQTGRRRKLYTLTDQGRRALRDWLADPHTESYELRDPGLLKLALGADPAALAATQLQIHQRALARYQELAAAIPPGAGGDGRVLALQAGIGHEQEYVRFWSQLAAGPGADRP